MEQGENAFAGAAPAPGAGCQQGHLLWDWAPPPVPAFSPVVLKKFRIGISAVPLCSLTSVAAAAGTALSVPTAQLMFGFVEAAEWPRKKGRKQPLFPGTCLEPDSLLSCLSAPFRVLLQAEVTSGHSHAGHHPPDGEHPPAPQSCAQGTWRDVLHASHNRASAVHGCELCTVTHPHGLIWNAL